MILVSPSRHDHCEVSLTAGVNLDVLRMVLGNTKWALDFSLFILNELFDLADEFENLSADQEAFSQKCLLNYHCLEVWPTVLTCRLR